jgi:hypothetical protein
VKVVGGSEICNFRIQSFVHFYTKFWSYSISNRCSAKSKLVGRALRRDVAPRRCARDHAPRPSTSAPVLRPRRPSPEAARRPKTHSSLGRPRPATRRSLRSRRRATRAVQAGRVPLGLAVRPRPPALVRRTKAGTSRRRHCWSSRPYLSARLSSSRRPTPLSPLHRACRGRRLASRRLARLLSTARVSISPRTRSTSSGHTLPSVPLPSLEPRAAAGGAVGHRRAPSLGQPRPQL